MTYRPRRSWLAWCVIADSVAALPPQKPRCFAAGGAVSAADGRIADAVERLASEDAAARDAAMRFLWAAGRAAEPALREAASAGAGADPEVAARARALLEKIESGLRPDTPAGAVELFQSYPSVPPGRRVETAAALLRYGDATARCVVRLWATEPDTQTRDALLRLMATRATTFAPLLLVTGHDEAAEQVLRTAAETGDADAGRHYVAYLCARGTLKVKLAERAAARSAPADRLLGWMHVADGNAAAARSVAERAQDDELLAASLFEVGDWPALAKRQDTRAASLGYAFDELALYAVFQHLAGNASSADAIRARIVEQSKKNSAELFMAAEVLLLTGRPEEGIRLLATEEPPDRAVELLCAQFRFDEALALAGKTARGQLTAARVLASLGEKARAAAALDAALAAAGAQGPEALQSVVGDVVAIEASIGRRDRAVQRALAAATEADRGRLVGRLFPRNRDAATWWRVLRGRAGGEVPAGTLTKLERLLARTAPVAEAEACVGAALDAAKAEPDAFVRRSILRAAADLAQAYDLSDVAVGCLEQAADAATSASAFADEGMMRLAERLGEAGQGSGAAAYYGLARGPDGTNAAATWMEGYALRQAGREQEGRSRQELARVLALADGPARDALAGAMERAGRRDDAAAEWELTARLHGYSPFGAAAAGRAARAAASRGDWARGADLMRRSFVGVACAAVRFGATERYLAAPREEETWRLMARLDNAPAERPAPDAFRRLVLACPADVNLTVQCVTALDARGRRDLADAAYAENARLLRAVCDRYPNSARYHNELAWLSVRCGRDLDDALAHASKAVELDPSAALCLDTLAEVYSWRGETARALECMKKCVALEPDSAEFRRRLGSLENGAAGQKP